MTLVVVLQDLVQQNNTLIEEMFHLIIMVVGESLSSKYEIKPRITLSRFD